MVRAFVALEMPPDVLAGVVAFIDRLAPGHPEFRWVARGSLHLTLKFLGEIGEGEVAEALEGLRHATRRWRGGNGRVAGRACPWAVAGTGGFPDLRRARALWLGVEHDGGLLSLREAVEIELAGRGFPREARRYSPHVTLARARGETGEPAPWLAGEREHRFGAVESTELVLFKSRLTPAGAVYSPLGRVEL